MSEEKAQAASESATAAGLAGGGAAALDASVADPDAAGPPKKPKAKDLVAMQNAQYEARQAKRQAKAEAEARAAEGERAAKAEARIAELEAAKKALEDRAKADPLSLAAELGGNVEEGIRDYVGKTTPEKLLAGLQREIADMKAAEKQRAADERKRAEQAQAEAFGRAKQAALASFVSEVRKASKEAPYLNAEMEDHEIYEWARQVQEYGEKNTTAYPFAEVLKFLESQAKLVHDRRTERRKSLSMPSEEGSPASASETKSGQQSGNGHRDPTKRPESRTSSQGSRSSSKSLTREEEEEIDLQTLRAAMAKDAAARANGKV